MDNEALNYLDDLPEPPMFREQLAAVVDQWSHRNRIIDRVRDVATGRNPVRSPSGTQYKIQVMHSRHLLAALNEKTARFLDVPRIAVVSRGPEQKYVEQAASREKWINQAFVALDQNSGMPVWGALVRDAILFDLGVERIERSPSYWPDLVISQDDKKNRIMRRVETVEEYEKEKDRYLREAGLPMRSVHVPANQYFPVYEATRPVQEFQVEYRNLRSVLRNKLFDTTRLEGAHLGKGGGISTPIAIVHYVNEQYHAYYALVPPRDWSGNSWPKVNPDPRQLGEPVLLYKYKHQMPQSIYNAIGGRFGGWKGNDWYEGALMEALCDLSDDLDTVLSQAATYNRGVGWPTPVTYLDPQIRGADDGVPKALMIQEGQAIALWNTERLDTLFKPEANPMFESLYDKIGGRIQELVGSSALYGIRQPGVETGYHHQLQISQSEHLDEKIEQNLANGAVNRARIIFNHAKALGEKIYVIPIEKDDRGRYFGKEIVLDPKTIDPMPQMAAKVRGTSPLNVTANLRALAEATAIRPGHNEPLYDDATAMEKFMGEEAPDEIIARRRIQKEQNRLLDSGFLSNIIAQRLAMLMVQDGTPSPSADDAAMADPALQEMLAQMNDDGTTENMGGVNPKLLSNLEEGREMSGMGRFSQGQGGGATPGMPQPEQIAGAQASRQAQIG